MGKEVVDNGRESVLMPVKGGYTACRACSTFHKMGSEEPGVVHTTPIPYAVYSGSFRIKVLGRILPLRREYSYLGCYGHILRHRSMVYFKTQKYGVSMRL